MFKICAHPWLESTFAGTELASHQPMGEPAKILKSGICAALASGVLACCAGCGTVGNGMFGIPQPYGGVRSDIETVNAGGTPCLVLDLPFSAVADTLLLPLQLPNAPPARDPLKG